ncbi:MAG: diguanylate cyclase [Rhizobium sp.]|nr:diguanylate cyclase [Rhizobium sp.]
MGSDGSFAFLLPFIFVTFGGVLLLVSHWGSLAARRWGIGYLLSAGGFVIPAIVQSIPVELAALTADALFLGAAYCYSDALFLHFGKVKFALPRVLFTVAIYAAIAFSVSVKSSLNAELLFGDIGFAGLLTFSLACVWRQARQRIEKILVLVVLLVIADCVVRNVVLVVVLPSSDGLESFASSNYAYLMQSTGAILGMLLAIVAIAVVVLDVISQYRDAAERDPMTKLLNRRGFERAVPAPDRLQDSCGIIICTDIDHFKAVNDTHGHAKGDLVLIAFAQLLQRLMPFTASISRFGGEEFVAYLPDISIDDARYLADTVRLALADHDWQDIGIEQPITASFGIGRSETGDRSIHDAVARADAALYAAKNAGRNHVMTDATPASQVVPLRSVSAA